MNEELVNRSKQRFKSDEEIYKFPCIPNEILDSRLMKRGGFDVFSGVIDETMRRGLLDETLSQKDLFIESNVVEKDTEEIRGGAPKRKFINCPGGLYQRSFYQSPWMIDFLRHLTTGSLIPTGDDGTYSHYSREGDYLDIHRDIVSCEVAVISCLKNQFDSNSYGGELCLYPDRLIEPLSNIKRDPGKGAKKLMLEEGQTLVMYGGFIPHALLPLAANQIRIVSVLCYQIM